MALRSCSHLSRTWPFVMTFVVMGATCVGQAPPDSDVESVAKGIRNGSLMGTGGIGYAVKIDQAMSDGKRLICSGAFISPHVILTAAHCTRNYDYGATITPTTDTVIRYGAGFATSQKIAGDEKVGWRELGSTDIGLYRVPQAVSLPVIPKLYRSCATVNLVGGRVVVYGRMNNGNQAPTAEYYKSPERTVRAVANGVGANGNYLQIDPTTDAGDSGGPWVYGQDRIVAVTHTSEYGSRFCDVASEIETQVKAWGDTLAFVEDDGAADGGAGAQGGTTGGSDAARRPDGGAGTDGRATGADGRADAGTDVTRSGGTGAGGMGAGGFTSQTGGAGGKAAGGSAGGVSGVGGSAGQVGGGTGGRTGREGGASGGAGTRAQGVGGSGGASGGRTDFGTTTSPAASGCSCRTLADARHARSSGGTVAFAAIILVGGFLVSGRRRGDRSSPR